MRPPFNRRLRIAFALAVLCICIAPASALGAQFQSFSFGSTGSGDGQFELAEHSGLAVNETSHDVYVADPGNHRVDEFDSSGTFVRAFGADVGGLGVNVCTSGCVAGTPGNSPGAFEAPTFIAVDNSAGASSGDVYVADTATKVVSKFEADGTPVASWGIGGQLSGNGSEAFGSLGGIAVDGSGELLVMWGLESPEHFLEPPGHVFRFAEDGSFSDQFETPRAAEPAGIAIGPSGFFKLNGDGSIEKLTSSGSEDVGQVTHANFNAGLAVDSSSGELFVSRANPGDPAIEIYAFEPSGEVAGTGCTPAPFEGCLPTDTFGQEDLITPGGVAADGSSRNVFVADFGAGQIVGFEPLVLPAPITEDATEVDRASATLNGSVNSGGVPLTACFFEWGETNSYGKVAACEDPDFGEVGEGSIFVPVHADVEGLEGGTTYHFRLVAENANGSEAGKDETVTTLGPAIRSEAASQVSASTARIMGEVNPRGLATSFVVQYASDQKFNETEYAEATTVPMSPKAVGSGSVFVLVRQQLSGLLPDTGYHFRIVATNAAAVNEGPDKTFRTLTEAPSDLPDGRAYEMVSPSQKAGEVFPPEPNVEIGSSCEFSECLPGTFLPLGPMPVRADGEKVLYMGQPFGPGLASGVNEYLGSRGPEGWENKALSSTLSEYEANQGYRAFSSDLTRSVIYQISPALSPQAPGSEGKAYANLYLREGETLRPLLMEAPPQRTPGITPEETRFEISFEGANAGSGVVDPFTHIAFQANDALSGTSAFAPAAPAIAAGQRCGVFAFGKDCNLYEWDEGQLRLVNVLPGNTETAPHSVIGSRITEFEPPAVDHAISDDGSRVFWSDETGQVFVRIDGEETQEIEASGRFLTANPQGTKVLLGSGCLYDLEAEPPSEPCEDLTQGEEGFEGILGASEDLGRIYFVDTKVLSGEEENENGEKAVEDTGKFNLYRWQEGEISFIGTLLSTDDFAGGTGSGDWRASSARRTAQVTPDGRFLAFMSRASLTGYDNTRSGGGACRHFGSASPLCNEVFEYDAQSGKLRCVSCNPGEQRPLGESNLSVIKEKVAAAAAPFAPLHNLTTEGQGRIFFESQDSLSPHDTNAGIQDVYEWEPVGVGGCAAGGQGFSSSSGGCVFLISSGNATNDSMFMDTTPSGDDAFFITRQQLLPRDQNDQLDLYDARAPHVVGEAVGFAEGEVPPCGPEACAGPIPSQSIQPVPGSAAFSGPGNLKPKPVCRKRQVRKHGKCVKKKHTRRTSKHNRGGSK